MDSPATVAVLTYHSIAAHTTAAFAALTVDPSLFAEQMEALHATGLDVIPFDEVPDALAARRSAVAITIDDGLADAGRKCLPGPDAGRDGRDCVRPHRLRRRQVGLAAQR